MTNDWYLPYRYRIDWNKVESIHDMKNILQVILAEIDPNEVDWTKEQFISIKKYLIQVKA